MMISPFSANHIWPNRNSYSTCTSVGSEIPYWLHDAYFRLKVNLKHALGRYQRVNNILYPSFVVHKQPSFNKRYHFLVVNIIYTRETETSTWNIDCVLVTFYECDTLYNIQCFGLFLFLLLQIICFNFHMRIYEYLQYEVLRFQAIVKVSFWIHVIKDKHFFCYPNVMFENHRVVIIYLGNMYIFSCDFGFFLMQFCFKNVKESYSTWMPTFR